VLTADQQASLEQRVQACKQACGAEVAVAIVKRVPSDFASPKEYATALFNDWGVGTKEADNGVLVLLSIGDRRVEIETGYGVEDVLPDQLCGRLLRKYAVPYFKRDDWFGGLQALLDPLCSVLEKGEPYKEPSNTGAWLFGLVFGLGFFAFFIALAVVIFKSIYHRCPNCGARMKFEQRIGTARRYRCPQCGTVVYVRALSTTATSSGYAGTSLSSSSSGGSSGGFGGGSSGGGGAGASF